MRDDLDTRLSRPASAKGRLQRAVLKLIEEHEAAGELPTSNRFLFYELVQAGLLDKTKTRQRGRGADQDLSDATKHLRDVGLVPWEWIVDETRSLAKWRYDESVGAYLRAAVEGARIDCWGGEPPPLILCESRTFGGVLQRTVAPEYLCPVAATNGQVGGFLHTNIAPVLRANERRVLYVGDLDLAGGQIEENTKRVLVHATGKRDWRRVALTAKQAKGLPVIEKVDNRYRPPRVHRAIEVEALGQSTVTELVRAGLDALLPEPLEHVLEREERQREAARAKLARWKEER